MPDHLRVSDADREVIVADLRTHTADGRLTLGEFEERVEQVYAAATHGDLRELTADLPSLRRARPRQRHVRRRPRLGAVRSLPVLLGLIAVVAIVFGYFAWWLIPLAFWVTGAWGCGHRWQGSSGHGSSERDADDRAPSLAR